jgi:rubredoxin
MNATTGDQQDPIGPEPAQPPPELATEPSTELATELPTEPPTEPPNERPKEASAEPEPAASPAASAGLEPEDDLASHRFECRSCGFVYDPQEGVKKVGIAAGTPFMELDPASFRCPVCRSKVGAFKDIGPRNKPSGFEENLNYGLGVNQLTPGQKNVLIFGGFALAFAFFLSLYSLR